MIDSEDIEIRHQLIISVIITSIIGLILYYTIPGKYKRALGIVVTGVLALMMFGITAHSIDKYTNNTILQRIRRTGAHINNQLLLMLTILPGIPPF